MVWELSWLDRDFPGLFGEYLTTVRRTYSAERQYRFLIVGLVIVGLVMAHRRKIRSLGHVRQLFAAWTGVLPAK